MPEVSLSRSSAVHHFVSYLYPYIDRGHGPLFRWLMLLQMDRMDPGAVCFLGDAATFAEDGLPFGDECEVAGFVFRAPSRERYREYRKYKLTREPFDRLLASSRGMLDAFRRMLTEDIPEIRALIDTQLGRIQEKHPRCALMTWANCPSLRVSAMARGIPVIHNELGPLRAPNFVPTVYFDFEGVNGATTAQRAAAQHIDERKQLSLSSLAARIDDLYVADDPAHAGSSEPEFEGAVALQVEDDSNVVAFSNGWSTAELMRFVVSRHGTNRTLVRGHPGSAFRLASPAFGRVDDSPDSLTFLRRAKCLYTINSSVASEAAFFNMPFRVFGENPVAMLENAALSRSAKIRDARRAFYFLAYLVPARLAFDVTYYEWRLARPPWEEVAERHLDVIRDEAIQLREETRPLVRKEPISVAPAGGETNDTDWLAGRSLSVQLRAMRKQVEWFSHQNTAWERSAREHAAQLEQLRDAFARIVAERDGLASECQRLDTLHRNANEEVALLSAALQESKSALDSASEDRAWIERERDKWQQVAQEAGARYAELEGKLKDAAEAGKWLEEQRSAWEKEAQARGEAAARWQEEMSRLQGAVRWAEEQRVAWERRAGELDADLESRLQELRGMKQQLELLGSRVESLTREASAQRLEIEELERQRENSLRAVSEAKDNLAAKSAEISQLGTALIQQDARIESQHRLLGERESELASAQAEMRALAACRTSLEGEVAGYELRLRDLEGRLNSALRGLRQRRHEVAVLTTNPIVRAAIAIGPARSRLPVKRNDKASAR